MFIWMCVKEGVNKKQKKQKENIQKEVIKWNCTHKTYYFTHIYELYTL